MTAKTTIPLGPRSVAETLFTYPNDGHEDQTLEQTITHYITDSLQREKVGQYSVNVRSSDDDSIFIDITVDDGELADAIGMRYRSFFSVGLLGNKAADEFKATGDWDESWKFLLPLGLPMEFARAVEIMDFPPLTLIKKQDYLNSKTTSRWWELLVLNGVSDDEKARWTCILDIVPVAAPASDGTKLDESGIYNGPFDKYTNPLLSLFSQSRGVVARRPLIALGLPIRKWIERVWNKSLNILDVDTISVDGTGCAVIASNHPSFFYYAVHSNSGTPDAGQKNLAAGLAVMKQDIVAAAWHAEMGSNPASDPSQTLEDSKAKWKDKDAELLALVKKQAGIPHLVELEAELKNLKAEVVQLKEFEPTAKQLAELEKKFYTEGRRRE